MIIIQPKDKDDSEQQWSCFYADIQLFQMIDWLSL